MHHRPFRSEIARTAGDPKALSTRLSWAGKVAYSLAFVAALAFIAFAFQAMPANAKEPNLPDVTIDHPQFIRASQATFLHANDFLIGVSHGKTVKAYPAAVLAQHGVVQDQMPDGPIAVTW